MENFEHKGVIRGIRTYTGSVLWFWLCTLMGARFQSWRGDSNQNAWTPNVPGQAILEVVGESLRRVLDCWPGHVEEEWSVEDRIVPHRHHAVNAAGKPATGVPDPVDVVWYSLVEDYDGEGGEPSEADVGSGEALEIASTLMTKAIPRDIKDPRDHWRAYALPVWEDRPSYRQRLPGRSWTPHHGVGLADYRRAVLIPLEEDQAFLVLMPTTLGLLGVRIKGVPGGPVENVVVVDHENAPKVEGCWHGEPQVWLDQAEYDYASAASWDSRGFEDRRLSVFFLPGTGPGGTLADGDEGAFDAASIVGVMLWAKATFLGNQEVDHMLPESLHIDDMDEVGHVLARHMAAHLRHLVYIGGPAGVWCPDVAKAVISAAAGRSR